MGCSGNNVGCPKTHAGCHRSDAGCYRADAGCPKNNMGCPRSDVGCSGSDVGALCTTTSGCPPWVLGYLLLLGLPQQLLGPRQLLETVPAQLLLFLLLLFFLHQALGRSPGSGVLERLPHCQQSPITARVLRGGEQRAQHQGPGVPGLGGTTHPNHRVLQPYLEPCKREQRGGWGGQHPECPPAPPAPLPAPRGASARAAHLAHPGAAGSAWPALRGEGGHPKGVMVASSPCPPTAVPQPIACTIGIPSQPHWNTTPSQIPLDLSTSQIPLDPIPSQIPLAFYP